MALASILNFQRELKGTDSEVKNLIRHVTLSTIKSYKNKYGKEYGELVLCCDGRKYWRRDFFTQYKAGRKKARDTSDLNWNLIFDTLSEMRDDIAKHFPWKVIYVERAEADDVIATMTRWCQTNQLVQNGLMEDPQPILILSSDKDFKQLQLLRNVKQWSPMQKKFVTATRQEIQYFMIEHIVKGDAGDGIPNILSSDDVFVSGGRQKPVSRQRLDQFYENGFDACKNDEERRNWHRNTMLIDFSYIPEDVSKNIIDTYLNNPPNGNKMSVFNYLMENRCRLLLDDIDSF